MAQHRDMKASDNDREQVTERLRHATADGRLFAHELEERLAAALRARTYGELDAVVADLPGSRVARTRSDLNHWVRPAIALAIAIPVAMVLVAAVVFVLTGAFAVWMAWMVLGWWLFGRHPRHRHHGHARHRRGPSTGVGGPRRAQPRPGSWL